MISLGINSSKTYALAQKMLSNPLKSIGEGVLAKPRAGKFFPEAHPSSRRKAGA
jgi:hypothetical protein